MKNMYFTTGTRDFLEKIAEKNEEIIITHGPGHSLLLHETDGASFFTTPRSYKVIASQGEIEPIGYFVLNNIPVTDEGRPIFEHRFTSRESKLDDQPGFIAFRLLRPIHSDTYVVLTEWSDPQFYDVWKNSQDFKASHQKPERDETSGSHIFTSASYVTTYRTRKEDLEKEENES